MEPKLGINGFEPAELSDAALMVIIAKRDRRQTSAFEVLYKRHYERIVVFLSSRRGLERGEAEDAIAEAFLVVLHKAGYFDPLRASFGTWLRTIALNKAADFRRLEKHHAGQPVDDLVNVLWDARSLFNEREFLVANCLRRLDDKYRQLVRMKYFQGLTDEEMAVTLKVPKGTIATRLRAARRALLAIINELPCALESEAPVLDRTAPGGRHRASL